MTALIIIIAAVLLLLILPLGVDAIYKDNLFTLYAKIWFLKFTIHSSKTQKNKKPKKQKQAGKKAAGDQKKGPGFKKGDIITIVRIILKTLSRFRKTLSIDHLKLHVISGAEDPYDAVLQYGWLNAGLSALRPVGLSVLNIRDEDICTELDIQSGKTTVEFRITATLQFWEMIYLAICTGSSVLPWYFRRKKTAGAEAKALGQKG